MKEAKKGDTVTIIYTAKLKDGSIFDSLTEETPFQFTIGSGGIIPDLESAVMGMKVGETKTFTIPPEKAYGRVDDSLIIQFPRRLFPEELALTKGHDLLYENITNEIKRVRVRDVEKSWITIDGNHPMAGQNLTYEIQLIGIS